MILSRQIRTSPQYLSLPSAARLLYVTMGSYADANGDRCYPSTSTLATDTGLTRRTVFRHLSTLKSAGLLVEQGKTACGAVRYRVVVPAEDISVSISTTNNDKPTVIRVDDDAVTGRHTPVTSCHTPMTSCHPTSPYTNPATKPSGGGGVFNPIRESGARPVPARIRGSTMRPQQLMSRGVVEVDGLSPDRAELYHRMVDIYGLFQRNAYVYAQRVSSSTFDVVVQEVCSDKTVKDVSRVLDWRLRGLCGISRPRA